MDFEIAELEQFIDSYIKDEPPASDETLLQTDETESISSPSTESKSSVHALNHALPEEYRFKDDFQQELLEHQKKQNEVQIASPNAAQENWNMHPKLDDPNQYLHANHHSTPSFQTGALYQDDWGPMGFQNQPHMQYPAQFIDAHPQYYETQSPNDIRPLMDIPCGPLIPEWVDTSKPPPPLPWGPQGEANNTHYPYNNHRSQGPQGNSPATNANWRNGGPAQQRQYGRGGPSQIKGSKSDGPWRRQNGPGQHNSHFNGHATSSPKDTDRMKTPAKKPPKNIKARNSSSPGDELHRSPSNTNDGSSCSRKSSQSSSSDGAGGHRSKVVCGRSKAEVRSWLRKERAARTKTSAIERKMGEMEISKDLPKFLKLAQSYISNDKKLKEVAEMLCKKAIKNPNFGEKSAVLCNEMSNHELLGTKFRSAVLTIIQGEFRSRHQHIAKTVQNPGDLTWIGFLTFLTELYENLRTATGERLNILVNPVYDCFFLMLKEKKLTVGLGECFYTNLAKVGRVLEKASEDKMSELISEIRDKCVMASPTPAAARRNLLMSLELYARGWSIPLDKEYFEECNDKQIKA